MPRRARSIIGGMVYHVLNRAAGRRRLFFKPSDFVAFEKIIEKTVARIPLRILSYCVMPTHFHFVTWPRPGDDTELSEFMRLLTVTHAQRYHVHFKTTGTGPVYQGRFKAFPVQCDDHFHTLARYVERNPLRARLVECAGQWRWSSLWRWLHGDASARRLLSDWPDTCGRRPNDWLEIVNRPQTEAELLAVRTCLQRNRPFGDHRWTQTAAEQLNLTSSLRSRGRPA